MRSFSTTEVLIARHLDETVADCADDAVFITPAGSHRGKDGVVSHLATCKASRAVGCPPPSLTVGSPALR
jgi:hypothetical protein